MAGELAMFNPEDRYFDRGGWVKETIDRDLSKYLESRQMKEGHGFRVE